MTDPQAGKINLSAASFPMTDVQGAEIIERLEHICTLLDVIAEVLCAPGDAALREERESQCEHPRADYVTSFNGDHGRVKHCPDCGGVFDADAAA